MHTALEGLTSACVLCLTPTPSTPDAVRRVAGKELKPVLGIVTAVIQKHPEVLNHGNGELPRRLFARIFTLLTLSIRCVHPPGPRICSSLAVCWASPRAGLQGGTPLRSLACLCK